MNTSPSLKPTSPHSNGTSRCIFAFRGGVRNSSNLEPNAKSPQVCFQMRCSQAEKYL
ncbi:hypothetical protein CY34DRAFT_797629 [Suillus luteus UH-Slu-Lm8-n1]|uniref:Uncharacterized protein n=1 Tax=Suillus luteus UH-Slu-Lm8-n1 TaxID=930992 RepID=A0A0D0AF53_9AGAM|nr:hypothetical protein CY34DRAFT_797629 [Suillus luteus UH-Slu-Lm8-n1]